MFIIDHTKYVNMSYYDMQVKSYTIIKITSKYNSCKNSCGTTLTLQPNKIYKHIFLLLYELDRHNSNDRSLLIFIICNIPYQNVWNTLVTPQCHQETIWSTNQPRQPPLYIRQVTNPVYHILFWLIINILNVINDSTWYPGDSAGDIYEAGLNFKSHVISGWNLRLLA